MTRFILTLSAMALLSGMTNPMLAEEAKDADQQELGGFVADEVEKGSKGKDLAAKIEAKRAELRSHHVEPGRPHKHDGADRMGLGADDCKGLGAFVQAQLDKGLKGEELAAAIHQELERRKAAKTHGKSGEHGHDHGDHGAAGDDGDDAGHGKGHGRPPGKGP